VKRRSGFAARRLTAVARVIARRRGPGSTEHPHQAKDEAAQGKAGANHCERHLRRSLGGMTDVQQDHHVHDPKSQAAAPAAWRTPLLPPGDTNQKAATVAA
jgi:hypothetical protein